MHADEIMYLFTMPIPHNETEIELSKKMLQVWTNFAIHRQVLRGIVLKKCKHQIDTKKLIQQGTHTSQRRIVARHSKLASLHEWKERIYGHQPTLVCQKWLHSCMYQKTYRVQIN